MDTKNYYEVLFEELKDKDFNEVLKDIDPEYEGKELDEVIDLLISLDNSDKIEKLEALIEKYGEDVSDKEEDIASLEEEYQIKIDHAQGEEEEANRSRINHIRDYNDYNNQIQTEMGPFVKDSITNRLKEVEEKLESINRKEQLLNGQLSRRTLNEKEKLQKEKDSLLKDKVDFEDFKEEARYLVNEDQKNIKAAQQKRNEIIEELNQKKQELQQEQKNLNLKANELTYIEYLLVNKLVENKAKYDREYNKIQAEFKEKIANNDYEALAKLGNEFLEKSNKKKAYDEKFYSISRMVGINLNEIEVPEEIIDTIEKTGVDAIEASVEAELVPTEVGTEEVPEVEPKEELTPEVPEVEPEEELAPEVPEVESEEEIVPEVPEVEPEVELASEEPEVEPEEEIASEEPEVESEEEIAPEEPEVEPEVELDLEEPEVSKEETNIEKPLRIEDTEEISDFDDMINENKQFNEINERTETLAKMFGGIENKPATYFDELSFLDRLENIIQLSTQAMVDKSIDRSSMIKTDKGVYIKMDLVDDYNIVISRLEELQPENDNLGKKEIVVQTEKPVIETPFKIGDDLEEDEELIVEHSSQDNKPEETHEEENLEYGFTEYNPSESTSKDIYAFNMKGNEEQPESEEPEKTEEFEDTNKDINDFFDSSNDETVQSPIDEEDDYYDDYEEEEFEDKKEETHSEGIFKKLFGKKEKSNPEHTIKNISDAPEEVKETVSDKFHRFMLDDEAYDLWKKSTTEKSYDIGEEEPENTSEGKTR